MILNLTIRPSDLSVLDAMAVESRYIGFNTGDDSNNKLVTTGFGPYQITGFHLEPANPRTYTCVPANFLQKAVAPSR
jgi:hypothetical protein